MKQAIIVIDIGMTNKKIAVYDEHLVQRESVYKEFSPIMIKGPSGDIPTHDIDGMKKWFIENIRLFAKEYPVRAISVTAHGATFVCVDERGSVCAPCIFYTYEPGEDFHREFYEKCGSPESLQATTYTPQFPALLNYAKGILFLQKYFADRFARTTVILGFPQYWSFWLTGKKAYEPTYLACHSYLWNQNEHTWSTVVDSLGIRSRMPETYIPTCNSLGCISAQTAKELGLDESVIVTAGIHDSNASLLPYIARGSDKDFILNSTGTWCVCMHPDVSENAKSFYNPDDIGKTVFFNRSALDTPVKTAIFVGGMEVDTYVRLYQKINKTDAFPVSDMQTVQKILSEKRIFLVPGVLPESGVFPLSAAGIYEDGIFYPLNEMLSGKSVPKVFFNEKLFFALLDISIAIQTETSVGCVGFSDTTSLYTEGGFRKNRLYNELFSSIFPSNSVALTTMKEATATGCAMSALMALTGKSCTELGDFIKIEHVPIKKTEINDYEAYKAAWLTAAQIKR